MSKRQDRLVLEVASTGKIVGKGSESADETLKDQTRGRDRDTQESYILQWRHCLVAMNDREG